MIRDYPLEWPRKLDFLPMLSLQTAVDENLELYYCEARASVQEGKEPRREVKTEYGSIKADPIRRNMIIYEKGIPDPRDGTEPVPQGELLRDFTERFPVDTLPNTEIPDVVIGERGVVERFPKALEDVEQLQPSEYVFDYQTARGNLYHRVRRALGIRGLANPYDIIKSKLLYYDIIKSPRPIQLKIRSTLKTRWVCTDAMGWSSIGPENMLNLELTLSKDKWWTDIGVPTAFQIPVNSGIRGQIYQLLKEKRLVVV